MTNGDSERLGKASGLSRRLLALLVGLLATVTLIASGAPSAAAQTRVGAQPQNLILTVGPQAAAAPEAVGFHALPLRQHASATGVAAETTGDLVPQLDKSFQFGGAGRSGAGVRNFVGPQNAVVRGASQGRVFVTDDQGRVVLDITRDRVKPVVPGQGFVAGDGRKLVPTQQQLDWIDQLWGG